MAKVTVIIPFYNRIEWVREAIKSVLMQTYQDFEVIVVDDGSDKGYKDQIEALDKRITYLRQENKGASAARNLGIDQSSGEYIAFLDSDDEFLPEKLEIQLLAMKQNPGILLSHTSYINVDAHKRPLQIIPSGLFTGKVYPQILALCPIATPTVVVQRSALKTRRFDENIAIAEDLLMWSRIAKESAILGINIPLTNVRLHGKNAVADPEKQLDGLSNIINYGLDADASISCHDRYKILHELYSHIGYLHIKQKRYIAGLSKLIQSFYLGFAANKGFAGKFQYLWSLIFRVIIRIAKTIVPKSIRDAIKDFFAKLSR